MKRKPSNVMLICFGDQKKEATADGLTEIHNFRRKVLEPPVLIRPPSLSNFQFFYEKSAKNWYCR